MTRSNREGRRWYRRRPNGTKGRASSTRTANRRSDHRVPGRACRPRFRRHGRVETRLGEVDGGQYPLADEHVETVTDDGTRLRRLRVGGRGRNPSAGMRRRHLATRPFVSRPLSDVRTRCGRVQLRDGARTASLTARAAGRVPESGDPPACTVHFRLNAQQDTERGSGVRRRENRSLPRVRVCKSYVAIPNIRPGRRVYCPRCRVPSSPARRPPNSPGNHFGRIEHRISGGNRERSRISHPSVGATGGQAEYGNGSETTDPHQGLGGVRELNVAADGAWIRVKPSWTHRLGRDPNRPLEQCYRRAPVPMLPTVRDRWPISTPVPTSRPLGGPRQHGRSVVG